jgi:Fe-S oxidoreductase
MLREFISNYSGDSPFNQKEIYDVLDLCLSCKGCKSECPSNVDMAKLKAEFLQHYYDSNRIPLRTKIIANISKINALTMPFSSIYNAIVDNKGISGLIKNSIGFAKERSLPKLHKHTLRAWLTKNVNNINSELPENAKKVYIFVDEFTNYNDVEIGIKAVLLLNQLGYHVNFAEHKESGRTYLSKGLLRKAKKLANENVSIFNNIIDDNTPLIGIEPSAILTFRDEYPDIVDIELKPASDKLAKNTLLFEEFISLEHKKKPFEVSLFTDIEKSIKIHGHCQQKSIATTKDTITMLSIPKNYSVDEIPSGCCGMAGSFGYEKEHYELSMKVGELVLFPSIREAGDEIQISAPGTSCRHQIKDGTQKEALHPIEILYDALKIS